MTTRKYLTITRFLIVSLALVSILVKVSASPLTSIAPGLGSAESFAVLAGSTVTNTGPTLIDGNLGVEPGSAVTGFPPGMVLAPGTIHAANAVALHAQNDVVTTYNTLAGLACNENLTGQDLGGLTLTPGVYCFNSAVGLTGVLTLNAQGNPNAVFVFKIGTTLTTASNAQVIVINSDNQACNVAVNNVFWAVGTSATLGTGTAFAGNLIAFTSNTLTTKASVSGRVIALGGAVTLDTNKISTVCQRRR